MVGVGKETMQQRRKRIVEMRSRRGNKEGQGVVISAYSPTADGMDDGWKGIPCYDNKTTRLHR